MPLSHLVPRTQVGFCGNPFFLSDLRSIRIFSNRASYLFYRHDAPDIRFPIVPYVPWISKICSDECGEDKLDRKLKDEKPDKIDNLHNN